MNIHGKTNDLACTAAKQAPAEKETPTQNTRLADILQTIALALAWMRFW